VDFGDWGNLGFDIEGCWSTLMRYKSIEVLSPLLNFGVIFFIAFRNVGTECLSFGDINYSIGVLIISIIV